MMENLIQLEDYFAERRLDILNDFKSIHLEANTLLGAKQAVDTQNIHEYVSKRNPSILAILRGLRPDADTPWTYADALCIEMMYHISLVCTPLTLGTFLVRL